MAFPIVIKPVNEGSSLGVKITKNLKDLNQSSKKLFKNYNQLIFEQFIGGQEIQAAVINNIPLGAIELVPKRSFYDYKAKYTKAAKTRHIMPARLSKKNYQKFKDQIKKLQNLRKNHKKYSIPKLKYYLPQPRVEFSSSVRNFVTSMIDISDGFIQDCNHLARLSNLEFAININNLPISDIDLLSYEERLNAALIGGDDYELLFTAPPVHKEKINEIAKLQGLKITNIGYIKNGKNGKVTSNNRPMSIDAYKHF